MYQRIWIMHQVMADQSARVAALVRYGDQPAPRAVLAAVRTHPPHHEGTRRCRHAPPAARDPPRRSDVQSVHLRQWAKAIVFSVPRGDVPRSCGAGLPDPDRVHGEHAPGRDYLFINKMLYGSEIDIGMGGHSSSTTASPPSSEQGDIIVFRYPNPRQTSSSGASRWLGRP